jgi:hypothetical protein
MTLILYSLIFHAAVGGLDVIFNHEISEHLPQQPSAVTEESLHSVRELLFGLLFVSLAWFEWRGAFIWLIIAIILAEIAVSTWDSVVEDRTRRLPAAERVMHTFLFINVGIYSTLLAPTLTEWHALPTELHVVDNGIPGRILSIFSAIAFAWCARDAISYFRLRTILRASASPTAREALRD